MRIITGSRGEPHITPQQDSLWHRGIQGTRDCVFEIGSKFAATRINDSTVSMADGTLSIQGRYACLLPGETEEVIIAPGRVDADRIDTICATITIDSGGLSEAAFEVIQGESGTDPEPPTIPTGDFDAGDNKAYFALYDVHLTGTTLDVITPKFGKYSPSVIDSELATELETKYGEQVLNADRSINIKEWIKAIGSAITEEDKTVGGVNWHIIKFPSGKKMAYQKGAWSGTGTRGSAADYQGWYGYTHTFNLSSIFTAIENVNCGHARTSNASSIHWASVSGASVNVVCLSSQLNNSMDVRGLVVIGH